MTINTANVTHSNFHQKTLVTRSGNNRNDNKKYIRTHSPNKEYREIGYSRERYIQRERERLTHRYSLAETSLEIISNTPPLHIHPYIHRYNALHTNKTKNSM